VKSVGRERNIIEKTDEENTGKPLPILDTSPKYVRIIMMWDMYLQGTRRR